MTNSKGEREVGQIQHEKIVEKLKKIKALAECGVGGEKETALRMYEELKTRYEIEDKEIEEVTTHWFSYKDDLEEKLLIQIFYKVTGSASYNIYVGRYKRRKKRGCDCTELEATEITLLFNFYREELKKEIKVFWEAFKIGNNLFPDETARCYEKCSEIKNEITEEERYMLKKAGMYSMLLDKNQPPRAMVEKIF